MPVHAHLDAARQRLLRALRRFHVRLADRVVVREPLSAEQERRLAERAAELGLIEKADAVRGSK